MEKHEARICRICWNTNNWTCPSGPEGKALGKSYEATNGFGHEEWLFRQEFQIDGFQYGFIQPIGKYLSRYEGNTYDLMLYAINSRDKTKYWVGNLKSVEVLTASQREKYSSLFEKKGWNRIIEEEALDVAKKTGILKRRIAKGNYFEPNVRFRAGQITENIYDTFLEHEVDDPPITSHRYTLLRVDRLHDFDRSGSGFRFDEGSLKLGSSNTTAKSNRARSAPKEPVLSHNKLMHEFHKYLKKQYNNQEIRRECPSNDNRVDLVRKDGKDFIFYELKTYRHVRTSIRVALGQILEYALFPKNSYAKKVVIVTDVPPDAKTETYIRHLVKQVKIPLGFIYFDLKTNAILLEI